MWQEVHVVQDTQVHEKEAQPCVLLVYGVYPEVHGRFVA